jgi:hypothetical protein
MPLIIVEGVDGSGKTTLVQNFRQTASRHCLIISRSGPPRGKTDLIDSLYGITNLGRRETPIIIDRHPLISEPIYGPIIRGSSYVDPPFNRENALEYVASTADRVIYCRTDLETAQRASRRERQMEGVHDQYWALYQAYDKYMEDLARLGVKIVPYDWTFDQSKDLNHLFLGA